MFSVRKCLHLLFYADMIAILAGRPPLAEQDTPKKKGFYTVNQHLKWELENQYDFKNARVR